MLQVIEREDMLDWKNKPQELGKGQAIEREMAHDLGLKVFHVYRPMDTAKDPKNNETSGIFEVFEGCFDAETIEKDVVTAIKAWYDSDCQDMSEVVIRR